MSRLKQKVVLYATRGEDLLVFDEPDFLEIGFQVPGGTVESGEEILAAAKREWLEETGLSSARSFELLGVYEYRFERGGVVHCHERHVFHVDARDVASESWETVETTPDGGGPPIRFRYCWRSLAEAETFLEFGFGEKIPLLRKHLCSRIGCDQ